MGYPDGPDGGTRNCAVVDNQEEADALAQQGIGVGVDEQAEIRGRYRTGTAEEIEQMEKAEGGFVSIRVVQEPKLEHITQERSEETARKLRERVPITVIAEMLDTLKAKHASLMNETHAERQRQNVKFTGTQVGVQHHSIIGWNSILAEEFGEAMQVGNDLYFSGGKMDDETFKAKLAHYRKELIETAAVSWAMVEAVDAMDPALFAAEGEYPAQPYPPQPQKAS